MARRLNGGGIGVRFEEDGYFDEVGGSNGIASSSFLSPLPSKHIAVNSSPSSAVAVGAGGLSDIVHPVSKFDTLAGVAIKYGVEVADIKRINGLVSDVQMFAMKTLQIPSPGRHPPSPVQSSSFDAQGAGSSETTPSRRRHSDLFDTFQSLKLKSSSQQDVSPSMSRLRDNGSKMADQIPIPEGFEIVYQNGGTYYLQDGPLATPSIPKPPVGLHRKCKSEANGFILGDSDDMSVQESGKGFIDEDDSDKLMKKLHVRRRQKSVADFSSLAPQMSAKEENSTEGNLSATVFKSLSLRPKSTNQLLSSEDSGAGQQSPMSIGLGESFIANIVNGIRKSSSTSSLQESDNGTLLSLWQTTKSCLKPDLNALSTAAITRPLLDGIITNPICGRKNKAAVD